MADVRLKRIEQKLDALTDHVSAIDRRMSAIDRRGGGIDRHVRQLDARVASGFARLEVKIDSMAETKSRINNDLSDTAQGHERRIVAV